MGLNTSSRFHLPRQNPVYGKITAEDSLESDALRYAYNKFAMGVCGEHGGDPASIALFEELGLNYVSCSPYRVPIARFAAARAVLDAQEK